MMNAPKQPSVKLIPSDPMTNTILIIYCVSSTGVSVPYKAIWRKINPKRGKVEELKLQNGSSYRCSPLDLDCVIEVTVLFQFQGVQMQRVVQSNLVKVSRQLKERRMYVKEPLPCKMSIDELPIQTKVPSPPNSGRLPRRGSFIFSAHPSFPEASFALHSNDFTTQADSNQHIFRIYLRSSFDEFMNFFSMLLGWRPVVKSQTFMLTFGVDINRDIILLGIAEVFQRSSDLSQMNLPKFMMQSPIGGIGSGGELDRSGHAKNRSQTTLSPANKDKIKISERVQMKKSQTNLAKEKEQKTDGGVNPPKGELPSGKQSKNHGFFKENRNEIQRKAEITSPTAKQIPKEKTQEARQYLNVFESDEEDLLTPLPKPKDQPERPREVSHTKSPLHPPTPPPGQEQNQPSINLRGSFQQLQRSFSNNNQQALEKVFGNIESSKKLQAQLTRLRKQNDQLKKQAELAASLSRQNMQIKKKYHELKQQINRLEMQRKVILTDKLRCQVNWHKQTQEKEYLKKELDSLREILKGGLPFNSMPQERIKSTSIHEVSNTDRQKERNRSPNSSFYNK